MIAPQGVDSVADATTSTSNAVLTKGENYVTVKLDITSIAKATGTDRTEDATLTFNVKWNASSDAQTYTVVINKEVKVINDSISDVPTKQTYEYDASKELAGNADSDKLKGNKLIDNTNVTVTVIGDLKVSSDIANLPEGIGNSIKFSSPVEASGVTFDGTTKVIEIDLKSDAKISLKLSATGSKVFQICNSNKELVKSQDVTKGVYSYLETDLTKGKYYIYAQASTVYLCGITIEC